jgi:hypothetical protein
MSVFPKEFAALEPFADWAVKGERAAYAKRLSSTMEEMQAFYDTAFPYLDQAREHLEKVPYDSSMSDEDKHLMWLFCALCTASFPVEVWHQPRVPDAGAAALDAVVEPAL